MVITVLCRNKTDITPDKMANENALLSKDTAFNIMIVPNDMAGFIRLHFNYKSMLQSSQYGSAVRWIHQNYMSDWCNDWFQYRLQCYSYLVGEWLIFEALWIFYIKAVCVCKKSINNQGTLFLIIHNSTYLDWKILELECVSVFDIWQDRTFYIIHYCNV